MVAGGFLGFVFFCGVSHTQIQHPVGSELESSSCMIFGSREHIEDDPRADETCPCVSITSDLQVSVRGIGEVDVVILTIVGVGSDTHEACFFDAPYIGDLGVPYFVTLVVDLVDISSSLGDISGMLRDPGDGSWDGESGRDKLYFVGVSSATSSSVCDLTRVAAGCCGGCVTTCSEDQQTGDDCESGS